MWTTGQSLGPVGPARDGLTPEGAGVWRHWRERHGGKAWVGVEVNAGDGVYGRAWSVDVPGLAEVLEAESASSRLGGLEAGERERGGPVFIARGLVETARLVATCRRHAVPLHLWFGGALRRRVPVALAFEFKAVERRAREGEIAGAAATWRETVAAVGVAAVAVFEYTSDADRAAEAVAAVRQFVGRDVTVTLRLAGQFSPAVARALARRIRPSAVACMADPCASVAASLDATRDALPALGLSAWRYQRRELLDCLAARPPAVLFIDPLMEGGPRAVRDLGSIARVFQVDVGLTAESGSQWLVGLAAELASVIPACRQPVTMPARWSVTALRAAGVCHGAIAIRTCDAPPAPGPPVDRP